MTQYEVLTLMESTLRRMVDNGIDAKDVRYLDLFNDYERLLTEGHKRTYILYYLSERYHVDKVTIYRVAARMRRELK